MERVFVIGHKNHDSDSIVGSIALAELKGFIPVRNQEKIWDESRFLLERFGFEIPEYVKDLNEKKVFLVDHNEQSQWNTGVTAENIVGIIDHHKFNFSNEKPILIVNKAVGSTCTILTQMFAEKGNLRKKMAGLLLGGILSDTDNLKSPTTTEQDKETVKMLAEKSGEQPEKLFDLMFKAQSNLDTKSDREIIEADFKLFENPKGIVGVGQVKVMDNKPIDKRKKSILLVMEKIKNENNCLSVMLMVTNIKDESTNLWIVGDESIAEKAFGKKVENSEIHLSGVLSRKKQIVPKLTPVLS